MRIFVVLLRDLAIDSIVWWSKLAGVTKVACAMKHVNLNHLYPEIQVIT